jgi:hypothetical protein
MPGIFSSCIIATRPGLSSCRSFGMGEVGRPREFGICIRNSKYESGTIHTEISCSSSYDSDRTFTSISSEIVRSQGGDVSSKDTSTVAATGRSLNLPATSRGFYSNKENNAMIFSNDSNDYRSGKDYGRRRKERQYQPSRSSSPCEWGYFVDTA